MTRVIFHPEARQDLDDAARWYDSALPGLGKRFRRACQAAVRRIVKSPNLSTQLQQDIRIRQVDRFPYGIIYEQLGDSIFIYAVMHLHREPGFWKNRI